MRWVLGAAFAVVACGGRTEIAGSSSEDAGALVRPVVTCHPGDPPVVLADGLITGYYDGIATDGMSVYVSQTGASTGTLWRISADDGARTVLNQMSQAAFDHLAPGDDGVYADLSSYDADAGVGLDEGYWSRADGLAHRVVHWGVFAPPLLYWRDLSITNRTALNVTSLTEGWTKPIFQDQTQSLPPRNPVAVTDRYLYIEQAMYADCTTQRIDRTDGSVHALANYLMDCLALGVAGPNAACTRHLCILDEDDTVQSTSGTLALDANYAYRAMQDGLHRVALRADQDDLVTTLAPYAVAVANGCVYVKTKTQLVRVAAP